MKRKYTHTVVALATLILLAGGGVAKATPYTVVGGEVTNDKSIAIGSNSKAGDTDERASVAVGDSADATGSGGVAIGAEAKARQAQGIAIGNGADALQTSGIAIGAGTLAHMNAVAFGVSASAQSEGAIAFGFGAKTGLDNSSESIAFGYKSNVTAVKSIAFGSNARAQEYGGVALGSNSLANRKSGIAGYDPLTRKTSTSDNTRWKATMGAVSLGDGIAGSSGEVSRQIIHVAAGSELTDAVNVAQLKASQTSLTVKNGVHNPGLLKLEETTSAENGTSYTLSLDTGALPQTTVLAGKGVSVSSETNEDDSRTYTVNLKDDQTFKTVTADTINVGTGISLDKTKGLVFTGGPSITSTGINAGSKKIINVADGTENSDAVNRKQLLEAQTWVTGDNKNVLVTETPAEQDKLNRSFTVKLNDKVDFEEVRTTTLKAGKTGQESLLNEDGLVVGTEGTVYVSRDSGLGAGNQRIRYVADAKVASDAVNLGQLQKAVDIQGEGLINVTYTTSADKTQKTYYVRLNENPTFINVSSDIVKTKKVQIIDANDVENGPSIDSNGIQMANQKITGLADGNDDQDAVNYGQLKKNKTDLALGKDESNLTSTFTEDENGRHYVLSLNKTVDFNQVTIGGTSGMILSSNGLRFGASANGPYFTTEGISAGSQRIQNVATAEDETDAVNKGQMEKYVEDTKTTVRGENGIQVVGSENTTGGMDYTVSLAESISFDGKLGNTTISSEGLTIVDGPSVTKEGLTFKDGGPSVKKTGIDAGGTKITNVAKAEADTDAVNYGQLKEEIDNRKTTVEGSNGISVKGETDAKGGTKYTVSLDKDISFDSVTTGETKITSDGLTITDGPSVTKDGINAGGKVISGVADGVKEDDAVNVKQLNERLGQSSVTISAKENGNITIEKSTATDKGGTEYTVALNDTVSVKEEVHVADTVHLSKNGVQVGESGPSMTQEGINAGGQVISNVAAGVNATDAVNVSQLNSAVNNVFRQVHSVEKHAQAGIAMAIATAGLPQAYLPGKSMMAISGGTYRGQSGYAFGFSHVTDNGRYVIKATGSGNSQGHFGASIGMGLQW